MKATLTMLAALVLAAAAGGCVKADVRVPDRFTFGSGGDAGASQPPSQIPPADPCNPAELARENEQLRRQAADLGKQLDKAHGKIDDLEEDLHDLRKELEEVKRQRDRYKEALDD